MKIQLTRDYCGRITNDHVLLKGEHEVDETVGAYLVGKGYAVDVTPVTDGREHTEDIAIALTLDELDNEDEPATVEPDTPAPSDNTVSSTPKAKNRK